MSLDRVHSLDAITLEPLASVGIKDCRPNIREFHGGGTRLWRDSTREWSDGDRSGLRLPVRISGRAFILSCICFSSPTPNSSSDAEYHGVNRSEAMFMELESPEECSPKHLCFVSPCT